jgi:hypothetical protein
MNRVDSYLEWIHKGVGRFQQATRFLVDPSLVLTTTQEETFIVFQGDVASCAEAGRMQEAFVTSLAPASGLPSHVLSMRGMSGRKYRRFIHRLVGLTPNAAYLEIGSWTGSTACSAMSGNNIRALCIDNWALFGGPKAEFEKNIASVLHPDTDFRFIESDYRAIDYHSIGKFNLYLFDGPHEYQDQYDGVVIAQPALAETYILIVDDWNWPGVRSGTRDALQTLDTEILYSIEIRTTQSDCRPMQTSHKSDWHNGYFFAACRKKQAA